MLWEAFINWSFKSGMYIRSIFTRQNELSPSRSWLIGEQTDSYSLFWSIAILISKSTKWDIDINIYKVRYSCTNLSSAYFKFLTNHLRMIDQSTEEVVITFDSDTVNDGLLWLEYLDRQRCQLLSPLIPVCSRICNSH